MITHQQQRDISCIRCDDRFLSNSNDRFVQNVFKITPKSIQTVDAVERLDTTPTGTPPPSSIRGLGIRSPLSDTTNTPPSGNDLELRRRRRQRIQKQHVVATATAVVEVRGLSEGTAYEGRVVSLTPGTGAASELTTFAFNTFDHRERIETFSKAFVRGHTLPREVRKLIAGYAKDTEYGQRDGEESLRLYDNGPRRWSVKRLTMGLKGLSVRTKNKDTTVEKIRENKKTSRRFQFLDKENRLQSSDTRRVDVAPVATVAPSVTIVERRRRRKKKTENEASVATQRRAKAIRRKRLQKRALNRL